MTFWSLIPGCCDPMLLLKMTHRNSGFSHEQWVDLSIVFCKRLPEGNKMRIHWILGWFWVNPIWESSQIQPASTRLTVRLNWPQFLRVYRASVRSKDPVSVHLSKPDFWRVMFIVVSTKSLFQVWFPQWLAACGITSTWGYRKEISEWSPTSFFFSGRKSLMEPGKRFDWIVEGICPTLLIPQSKCRWSRVYWSIYPSVCLCI